MTAYAGVEEYQTAARAFLFGKNFSITGWLRLIAARVGEFEGASTRERAVLVLDAIGVLPPRDQPCKNCGMMPEPVPAPARGDYPLGLAYRCACAGRKALRSAVSDSIWATGDIYKFLLFTLLYLEEYPRPVILRELGIAKTTYSSWSRRVREFLSYQVLSGLVGDSGSPRIGGPGQRVEMDETLIQRTKPWSQPFQKARRTRKRHQTWLWGAAASDDGYRHGEVVFVPLLDLEHPRGRVALQAALLATVRPGSIVLHDDWGAYRAIQWSTLPFEHGPRNTVNHSKEIKNIFGEHTNHIEAVWSALKRWLRKRGGGRIVTDQLDLSALTWEFTWRLRARAQGTIGTFFRNLTTTILQSPELMHAPIEVERPLLAADAVGSHCATGTGPIFDSSEEDCQTATTEIPSFSDSESFEHESQRFGPDASPSEGVDPPKLVPAAAADIEDAPRTATTEAMSSSEGEAAACDAKRRRHAEPPFGDGCSQSPACGSTPAAACAADAAARDGPPPARDANSGVRARHLRRNVELRCFGTSAGCAACTAARGSLPGRGLRHTAACRVRVEAEIARASSQ
jgi:hypothetical protein